MRFLTKVGVVAIAIALTTALVPGIEVDGGVVSLLWIAFVFTVVNLVLKPIATLLSLPLLALTFGLFALVVNAGLYAFTAWLTTSLDIDGFLPAFWGALIISVVVAVADVLLSRRDA